MELLNKQRGSAVIMGMGVILALIIIVGGLIPLTVTEVRNVQSNQDVVEAQYVAEAGAKRALVGFLNNRTDWAWADGTTKNSFQDSSNKAYRVSITPAVTNGAPPSAGEYLITSTGFVGNASKQVEKHITVKTGGGSDSHASGDVFAKYVVYAKKDFYIYGGEYPIINGYMGLAGDNVTIAYEKNFLKNKVYVKKFPAGWRGWPVDWLTSEWYVIDPVVGTLTFKMPEMPTMPTFPSSQPSGSTLLTASTSELFDAAYYYNGSYARGGNITSNKQATTLYINGGLHLTSQGTGKPFGSISSIGNITLYVNGSINLSNGSFISTTNGDITIYASGGVSLSGKSYIRSENGNVTIKANQGISLTDNSNYFQTSPSGVISLYSLQDSINLSNNCYVNGGTVVMQAMKNTNFANLSSVNNDSAYAAALAYIYADGSTFTNAVTIGGKAALVTTNGPFNINSSVNALGTIYVSNSGQSNISNSPKIAGIYTNGSLNIANSPQIAYNNDAIKALGLDGSGSGGLIVEGNWSK